MISGLVKNSKLKKMIVDFGSNIIASAISIIALQIVVFPTLAKTFQASVYGELLTIIGIVNIVTSSFGNTLNNTRLIQNADYEENDLVGDFNILLIVANWVSVIVIIILGHSVFNFGIIDYILISLWVIFGVLKSYISVAYRLILNFRMIIILNLLTSAGYLFGTFLVHKTGIWVYAFLFGELFSCIFLFFTTDLWKESYKKTNLFKITSVKYLLLIVTGLLANVTVYLDRLIIYPLLGSKYVSTYTTASFFGKSLGLVMLPISGVLLSYYAQRNFKMDHKRFWGINLIVLIMAIIFFFFAKIFSVWFTGILYPTLIDAAKPYILLANTAAIIDVVANMASPIVLKYSPTYWQVIIQVVYLITYFGLSLTFISFYGLLGFCIAAICANVLKVILFYFSGARTFSKIRAF